MATKKIDFRSDTLTTPDDKMRQIMASAEVGDDVFNEDPTVQKLESDVADLLGKEAALFVPSGTMSNVIATMIHCQGLFSEVIMGDESHTFMYEAGSSASLCRAHCKQIQTSADGTLPLDLLKKAIQVHDVHCTRSAALFLENTHNKKGGKVLPMDYVWACRELCDQNNVKLHCDGARLWNAAVASNQPISELAKPFDSVSVCLSKGLGAPVGSLLVGSRAFIAEGRHARKLLGGGMRQVGVLAAAGIYAVQHMYTRLHEDHSMARQLADGLSGQGFSVVKPDTNIVIWDVGSSAKRETFLDKCTEQGLLLVGMGNEGAVRAVPHYGNSAADIDKALQIIGGIQLE